ncbi:hypothetical protein [Sphingobium estronivorans]|uniref:hypothetical protein n=1 Tax=Sphingobium estronivorans TaxID=1577690 RepID=UPI00123AC0A3|nr:hypothetical protein [Sphingobium estronivorans]
MRYRTLRRERIMVLAGTLVCGGVLLASLWSPRAVLTGWLGGAVAFGAVPSGALLLMMMMRLIPGLWGDDLRLSAEAATLLTPLAAAAMLPVLVGMGAIYPWVGDRSLSPFQLIWLSPLPFALRTLLRFAAQWWLGHCMRARLRQTRTAGAGVMLMPMLTSLVAVDWLMSLDAGFTSSAFGLEFIQREVTIGFCALLLLRLNLGRAPVRPSVLGGLLLTLLLLSAYFLFLPFFVIWSSNLAPNVEWYARRWDLEWEAVAWAFGLLGGIPLLALLFARIRSSLAWLKLLSVAVLFSTLLQLAWVVLPLRGATAALAFCATLTGLGLFGVALLPAALRQRIDARLPRDARR